MRYTIAMKEFAAIAALVVFALLALVAVEFIIPQAQLKSHPRPDGGRRWTYELPDGTKHGDEWIERADGSLAVESFYERGQLIWSRGYSSSGALEYSSHEGPGFQMVTKTYPDDDR